MEHDEKQFFSIFGAWGILFFVLLLSMVDSIPETATYPEVIPDVVLKASFALIYASVITIVLLLALGVCQLFARWIQSTNDPRYGQYVETEPKPQIEMDVFILAKSIMEQRNNTAVFLLFSKLPYHTQTPFIDDQGRFFMNGKQICSEHMMQLLRDAARELTPENFQYIRDHVDDYAKRQQEKDDF